MHFYFEITGLVKKLFLLYKYFLYKLRAVNEHGIHSPFVFTLYNSVIKNSGTYYAFDNIEKIRAKLLSHKRNITVLDLGAGSNSGTTKSRTIADITKTAAKNEKYAQLLFRFANHFQPKVILELGTSVGISTMYFSKAVSRSKIITVEGSPEIQKIAAANFKELDLNNITSINANFDDALPEILAGINDLDLVFFDGNHLRDPTLNYFNQCLLKAKAGSIFIFDDIYWSKEMSEAWEIIKSHPQVTVTIDIFQLGIVFFRKEQRKQHFILRH